MQDKQIKITQAIKKLSESLDLIRGGRRTMDDVDVACVYIKYGLDVLRELHKEIKEKHK